MVDETGLLPGVFSNLAPRDLPLLAERLSQRLRTDRYGPNR